MKKIRDSLVLLTLFLVMTAGIGRAWAYFTTYTEATGSIPITLGDQTTITEEFSNWEKRVTIKSEADSQPVYIRVKAFCSGSYSLTYSGDGWSQGEGDYYYYSGIVSGGGETSQLSVKIGNVPEEDLEDGMKFNVIVIYESTPVMYNEDGTPYADWNVTLDNGISESGGAVQKEGE